MRAPGNRRPLGWTERTRSSSVLGDVEDGVGEFLGCLLRDVVAYPVENSMVVSAGEQLAVGAAVFGGAVEIAGDRDGRHRDRRHACELPIHRVVLRLALCQALAPPAGGGGDG